MEIDDALIEKIAGLAKLNLTTAEKQQFSQDLQEVLDAFETLDELDTSDAEPSYRPIEEKNRLRKDEVRTCLTQQQALQYTEDAEDGYFVSPKTIE